MQVNHTNYGTLFAALIKGSGKLLSGTDEEGQELPFFTTAAILKELERFGFYITYAIKSNLPMGTIAFLNTLRQLGYDKVTRVNVETTTDTGGTIHQNIVLAFKSESNSDLLTFGCKLGSAKYSKKLSENTVMNITHQKDTQWDWVEGVYGIEDILDENIDPTDTFETDTNLETGQFVPYQPLGSAQIAQPEFTVYDSEEVDESES